MVFGEVLVPGLILVVVPVVIVAVIFIVDADLNTGLLWQPGAAMIEMGEAESGGEARRVTQDSNDGNDACDLQSPKCPRWEGGRDKCAPTARRE